MNNELLSPAEIQWIEGELPDVHSVPYNCRALVWKVHHNASRLGTEKDVGSYTSVPAPELEGKFKTITIAAPWQDKLNQLRWCDSMPIGFEEKVKFYAWLSYPS